MSTMNVGDVTNTQAAYQTAPVTSEPKVKADTDVKKESETAGAAEGAVYEKSTEPEKKATYSINKMSAEDRKALVEQMKKDELARQNQLIDIVRKMITGQAGASNLADLFNPENLKDVSAADISKAKEDVSEDGYWGVKQTSERLFDFASALAGDDVDAMKKMQAAMEKGFKAAGDAWGKELPDISKETLKAANKLFDDYYASKNKQVVEEEKSVEAANTIV